ncbi:MAG TPA: hypothetical protein VFZ34_09705 [Blastocatellia bacterium]|nr:hypothetical protein [Blastocatellia bacterium]
MKPAHYFILQFGWFLLAWSVIARLFIVPALQNWTLEDALAVWIAPHLFRVLGVGLLVPNLAPGLPVEFAATTAIGDSLTAVLALGSLVALRQRWSKARTLVWGFNLIGSLDLTAAMIHAAWIQAATYLHAQWYVPALVVPLMIVAHVMVFRTLLRQRTVN